MYKVPPSRRQLASLWSLQVLFLVLNTSRHAEALDLVVKTILLLPVMTNSAVISSYGLLTGRPNLQRQRIPLFRTAHPENELGRCDGFWEKEVLKHLGSGQAKLQAGVESGLAIECSYEAVHFLLSCAALRISATKGVNAPPSYNTRGQASSSATIPYMSRGHI